MSKVEKLESMPYGEIEARLRGCLFRGMMAVPETPVDISTPREAAVLVVEMLRRGFNPNDRMPDILRLVGMYGRFSLN